MGAEKREQLEDVIKKRLDYQLEKYNKMEKELWKLEDILLPCIPEHETDKREKLHDTVRKLIESFELAGLLDVEIKLGPEEAQSATIWTDHCEPTIPDTDLLSQLPCQWDLDTESRPGRPRHATVWFITPRRKSGE